MRNVFLSFHQADELEANVWCRRFSPYFNEIRTLGLDELGDEFAERINSGDSDYVMRQIRKKKIAGTSCTVVLIGKCTWARRYVDWEIAATLRDFGESARGGLIAVQLPSAQDHGWSQLPPRLELNLDSGDGTDAGYARFYAPAPSDDTIAEWVEAAVARRDSLEPTTGSTSDLMKNNRTCA
ncbi:MAG TPA: TIR domain-containing protein [Baekduia sp.]|uniref:TIR domain-containing protein n=1 Tax=Baekduia sp. TaxID=2600305 RepID=UPI002BA55CBB|nr:TIR domain-containing protein [Baekduia sp.]HMJ35408.1 TIR domain-containing protein [Baekduia sp.]